MLTEVPTEQVEVICKWCGENFRVSQLVAMTLFELHDEVDEWLENHEEDTWTIGIALKNSPKEVEDFTDPVLGDYFANQLAV